MDATSRPTRAMARYGGNRGSNGAEPPVRPRRVFVALFVFLFSLAAWGHGPKGERDEGTTAMRAYVPAKLFAQYPPQNGGVMLRASNGYHHLEAVFTRPRYLKFFLYDQFGESIQGAYFRGAVAFRGEPGTKPVPIRIGDDGMLEASLPPRPFPLLLEVRVEYGGPVKGPPPFRDVFDLEFDRTGKGSGGSQGAPNASVSRR